MTQRRVPFLAVSAALALLAVSQPAHAKERLRAILLPVVAGFGVAAKDVNTVEEVLHDALDQTNLKMLSQAAMRKLVTEQQIRKFADCQQQEDCLTKAAVDVDTDVIISALMTHEGKGSAISLKVLVGRASEVISRGKEFVQGEDELFDAANSLAKSIAEAARKNPTLVDRTSGKKKQAPAPVAVTGSIGIITDPPGATLDVTDPSGVKVTQPAPYRNEFAALGKWKIVAHAPNCADEERDVEIAASAGADITITLKRMTGLRVIGDPDGAAVVVSGPGGFHDIRALPWEDLTLSRGPYRIRVTHLGYVDDNESVNVKPGEIQTIHVSLTKTVAPPAGSTTGMIEQPAGSFHMGSEEGPREEQPVTSVALSSFWIDKTEVTAAAYGACVRAGGCEEPSGVDWNGIRDSDRALESAACNWGVAGRENHPINCVEWSMADSYCKWAGKQLPTEAQWEFAARGSDDRNYPWGNDPPAEKLVNACGSECRDFGKETLGRDWKTLFDGSDGFATTAPVGSFPAGASATGVMDMAGNVWEWVADTFMPYAGGSERDPVREGGIDRVVRGGGWNTSDVASLHTTHRRSIEPGYRGTMVGFRCAKKE